MLAEAFYYILVSNLEKRDGQQALTHRGLELNYTGKGTFGHIEITSEDHWFDVYMMLVDAVESERNVYIDKLLTTLEHPPVALREVLR